MLGQLMLIGYNLTYLLVMVINYRKYISKLYWFIGLLKSVILLGFQMGYLFLPTIDN
jgi:hypothetical protein